MLSSARRTAALASLVWRIAPVQASLALVMTGLQPLAGAGLALAFRSTLDGIIRQDETTAVLGALTAASAQTAIAVGWSVGNVQRVLVNQRVGEHIDRDVLAQIAMIRSTAHFADPESRRTIDLAQQGGQRMVNALWIAVTVVAAGLQLVVTLALLMSVHWVLGALTLFVLPTLWATRVGLRKVFTANTKAAVSERAERALFDLAVEPSGAREIRRPDSARFLRQRAARLRHSATRTVVTGEIRAAAAQAAGWGVFFTGWFLALLFTCALAVRGQTTLGSLLLVATLAMHLRRNLVAISHAQRGAADSWESLAAYQELARRQPARAEDRSEEVPSSLARGITLTSVSFRYDDASAPALLDINLHLPAGAIVALVGEHGCGKSTLIDLLCGFREPTSGEITVDGIPLRSLSTTALRRRTTGVFQNGARFPLLARESIGIGDLPRMPDTNAIAAAARDAGADRVLTAFPDGFETLLGHELGAGRELSGGQWQSIALARVFFRQQPLLAVLDEPTAALDAAAERETYTSYAHAARHAAQATGGVTVLVTHRFTTVPEADLIVVLADGQVREVGTHQELLARDGGYAHLCRLQAASFC